MIISTVLRWNWRTSDCKSKCLSMFVNCNFQTNLNTRLQKRGKKLTRSGELNAFVSIDREERKQSMPCSLAVFVGFFSFFFCLKKSLVPLSALPLTKCISSYPFLLIHYVWNRPISAQKHRGLWFKLRHMFYSSAWKWARICRHVSASRVDTQRWPHRIQNLYSTDPFLSVAHLGYHCFIFVCCVDRIWWDETHRWRSHSACVSAFLYARIPSTHTVSRSMVEIAGMLIGHLWCGGVRLHIDVIQDSIMSDAVSQRWKFGTRFVTWFLCHKKLILINITFFYDFILDAIIQSAASICIRVFHSIGTRSALTSCRNRLYCVFVSDNVYLLLLAHRSFFHLPNS